MGIKKSNIISTIISFYLILLFSSSIFLSVIPFVFGMFEPDNIITTIYKLFVYLLSIASIIIIVSNKNLYLKIFNKYFVFLFLFYLYYIFVIKFDLFNTIKAEVVFTYEEKMAILTRMQRSVLLPIFTILALHYPSVNQLKIVRGIVFLYLIGIIVALGMLNVFGGLVIQDRLEIEGAFNSLNLGYWGFTASVLNLFVIYFDTKGNLFFNKFILAPLFFITVLYAGSRGPLIYLALVIGLFFLYSGFFKRYKWKIRFLFFLISLFLIIGYDLILDLISVINPIISERLLSTIESADISGRDGAYEIGMNQFLSSPFFGDYFVLTSGPLAGLYPHNILIEALMTFGIIGSIPLFYLFIIGIKKGFYLLKMNQQQSWVFLIFLSLFLKGMSTWNLYGSDELWISLSFLLTLPLLKNKSNFENK